MRAFRLAMQLLTRIPFPEITTPTASEYGRSVLYYPLVGLILGLALSAAQALFTSADALLASAILLLFWILFTGGLHLDGLADSADAWAGAHGDRETALRLMKDPASGPAGVTAIALVLLLKFSAVATLLKADAVSALILAPVLGRMAIVALFLSTAYVRPQGLGSAQAEHLPRRVAIGVLSISALALLIGFGRSGAWALLAAVLVLGGLRRMMQRRLGGCTGDTLGASCELVETAVVVVLALLMS